MIQESRGGLDVSDQQAVVVDHVANNKVTVVGAGAGSGKTHTTVATVVELVQQKAATLDQFVLITFTNKAANELRARLEQVIGMRVSSAATSVERLFWRDQQERMSAAYIGTIHGFCARVLHTFGYEERVAREAGITFAQYRLTESLQDAVEAALNGDGRMLLNSPLQIPEYELRRLAREILLQARGRGMNVGGILARTQAQIDDPGKPYRVALAELVSDAAQRYDEWKSEDQALDADDLLSRTAQLLAGVAGERTAERLGERYRYIFIDEFQDTDEVQKQIIDHLLSRLQGVLVVGDRKQSIYGFRAANVELIQLLANEHGVSVLPLSISRRPTEQLLAAQNALFASMAPRYPELGEALEPWNGTVQHRGGLVPMTFVGAAREQKFDVMVEWIRSALEQQLVDPVSPTDELRDVVSGDIAVLVRSNSQLEQYERELRTRLATHGIEIRQDAGGQFYQQPEILGTYRMLRLLLHYPSDPTLSMALASPYLRHLDASSEERRILQYRPTEGTPLTDWLESEHPEVSARLSELRRAVRIDTVPQILERLYQSFDMRGYYKTVGDQQAIENLEKLREMARQMFNDEQALTLRQFVDAMRLAYLTDREESEAGLEVGDNNARPAYVRIMTVHRAKGLEFPIVVIPELQRPLASSHQEPRFILDQEHGLDLLLPAKGLDTRSARFRSLMTKRLSRQVAEEMRVFYVAVTRAQTAVALFGSNRSRVNNPDSEFYGWQDEVLRAQGELEQNGGLFIFR